MFFAIVDIVLDITDMLQKQEHMHLYAVHRLVGHIYKFEVSWRRTVEKAMKVCNLTWDNITRRATDRQLWRPPEEALCAT